MKHIKLYEDEDLLKDMRGLTLAPKMHSYFIQIKEVKNDEPYSAGLIFIGDDWDKLMELYIETFGITDADLPPLEEAMESKDINDLMQKTGELLVIRYDYTHNDCLIWELKPKSGKTKIELLKTENPAILYKAIKENFIEFDRIMIQNEYGNI